MSEIEKIEHNGNILAIVVKDSYRKEGTSFISPDNYPLQLGFHNQKKNFKIKPHVHENPVNLDNVYLQEIFVIKKGKVKFNLYYDEKKVKSVIVAEGDSILLASGGHGVEFLEDTSMVEIRQGPYMKEGNKRFIEEK